MGDNPPHRNVPSRSTSRSSAPRLGSGIAAGSTASIYDHTTVYEINPAILEAAEHFAAFNDGVLTNPKVDIRVEDGLRALLTEDTKYDAIVSTVTSPRYYASEKLYTIEFYRLVRSRLAEGGVFSGWFDLNIGEEGMAILRNTLETAFGQCRYFVLAKGYFNVVCGEGALVYRGTGEVGAREHNSIVARTINQSDLNSRISQLIKSLEQKLTFRMTIKLVSSILRPRKLASRRIHSEPDRKLS